MRKRMFFGTRNGLFLLWHNRWFGKPLTDAEVDTYLAKEREFNNVPKQHWVSTPCIGFGYLIKSPFLAHVFMSSIGSRWVLNGTFGIRGYWEGLSTKTPVTL